MSDRSDASNHPGSRRTPDVQSILAAIVESSDDAIYSKDEEARVTTWNPAAERLYGYAADEIIGQDIAIIIPPDRRGEERFLLQRVLNGEKIDHYETERVRKDGGVVEVSLAVSPIRDSYGTIVGASVISRNIEDRRRQEALEREIEKRDFITRAAHELKNPLTTIAGMAQILRDSEASLDPEDKERVFGSLIRQSDRANRLIGDLLELARLESGQVEMEIAIIDLREVVSGSIEAAAVLDKLAVENQVDVAIRVRADAFRLEEVFVNLFSNSAKYGASRVITSALADRSVVRVIVADDGPGVPEKLAPTLFEPFTRAPGATVAGSGLGLSIAKRLCEAMGGDIRFEPNEPTGATFVITLRAA